MADEIELKLELTPADADALEASALLPGDPETTELRALYFDTPNHDLARAGLSLRIRRSNGTYIQTVKAGGADAAGLFVRSEWEQAVTESAPILDATPIPGLLGDAVSGVAPIFEVVIKRRTWIINRHGAAIELVVDRGEAVAGDRRTPICEIELELKSGDESRLFELARRIDATVPVRLGVMAKAERGYRLIGPIAAMSRAERITLASDPAAAQAFQLIVQSCIRQFRLNENMLLIARNADALHQARVALRRLRSAFSMFGPVIGRDAGAALRARLRRLASELGEARNLDMLYERAKPGELRDRIAAAREAAYDRVETVLASPPARSLMLDLAEWITKGDWLGTPETQADRGQPSRAFAITALDRFRRKVRKGGRGFAKANDEARHQVRKDAKTLRYTAEFFVSLFDRKRERRRYKRFIDALEDLQDQLGALNDHATAPNILAKLGIADHADAARLMPGDPKKPLLAAAVAAHETLMDTTRFWR